MVTRARSGAAPPSSARSPSAASFTSAAVSQEASTSPPVRPSRATELMPKAVRDFSRRAGRASAPRRTLPARVERVSASAVARAARAVRRVAWSTTVETVSATAAKTTRAMMLLVSPMVKAWTGGMKK